MLLAPNELDHELLDSTADYHFGSVSLAVEPCRSAALEGATYARDKGALVSFDVNYRPSLWRSAASAKAEIVAAFSRTDIVKVNEFELEFLTGMDEATAGCAKIIDWGPALCIATLGPRGSAWAAYRSAGTVPGFSVDVVDTTGCGDACMAALLVRVLSALHSQAHDRRSVLEELDKEVLADALRWSNAAGALTARRKGVMPALPNATEVMHLVES
jgi:fructokinase